MKRENSTYVKPTNYTHEELNACAILDLESDLAFEIRNGNGDSEYANYVRGQLARIRAGEDAHAVALSR
jgi:hypothetical protein